MIIYILIGCIFFILVVIIIYIYYYNYYYKKIILDPHNKNNEEYLHTLNEKKPPTEEEIMFNEIKDGLKDLIKTIALFKELDLTFSDLNNIINDSYIAINLYTSIDNIVYHFKGNNIKDEYRNNINKAILKHLLLQIQTTLPIDIITTDSSTISSSTSDTIVVSKDIYNAISSTNIDSTISNIDKINPENYEDKINDLLVNSNALKTKIMDDLNTLINDSNNNIEIYNTILNYKLNIDLQESKPPIFTIANMDQFKLYNKYIDIRNIFTGEINNISDDISKLLQNAISSLNNALKTNTDMVKNMVKYMVINILSINIDNEPLSILKVYDKLNTNFIPVNIIDETNKINSITTITTSSRLDKLLELINNFNNNKLTKTLLDNTITNILEIDSGIGQFSDTTTQLDILDIYNKLKDINHIIDIGILDELINIIDITIKKNTISSISSFSSNIKITILKYTIMKELHYIDITSSSLIGNLVSIESIESIRSNESIFDNLLYNNKLSNIDKIITDINNAITKALSIIKLEYFANKYNLNGININNILSVNILFANIRLFFTTILEYNLTNIDNIDNLALLLTNIDNLALLLTNIHLQDFNTKSISDNFYNNITSSINADLINNTSNISISDNELTKIIDTINNDNRAEGENYMSYPDVVSVTIIKNKNQTHTINFNTGEGLYQPVANIIESCYQFGSGVCVPSLIILNKPDNYRDILTHNINITKIYSLHFVTENKIDNANVNIIFKHNDKIIRQYNFNIINNSSNQFYNFTGPIHYRNIIDERIRALVPLFFYIYTINFEQPVIIYKNSITITVTITNNSSNSESITINGITNYSSTIKFLNFKEDNNTPAGVTPIKNFIKITFN